MAYLSGTSMAAPHVAGVAAVLHSQGEYALTAEEVEFELINASTQNVLHNIPNETMDGVPGTPNALVYLEPCGEDGPESSSMSAAAKSIRTTMNYLSFGFVLIISFNFGLQTTPVAISKVCRDKWKFLLILLIEALAVPLLCLIFTKTLQMHYDHMLTVFFVALFPGGVVSNMVFIKQEQRNYRLSTVISFLQNSIAVVSIPIVFAIMWAVRSDDINNSDVHWIRLLLMLACMLLLSLMGLVTRSKLSDERSKAVMSISRDLTTAVSMFVLLLVLLLYSGKLLRASLGLWAAAILVQLGCGFAGVMTAVMFNSKASECVMIGTEFAFRNCFLAIGVIAFAFSGETRENMFVFALIYSFVSSLLVLAMAPVVNCFSCFSSKKDTSADLDTDLITAIAESRSDAVLATTTSSSPSRTTSGGGIYNY